jgi:hypothetical protein
MKNWRSISTAPQQDGRELVVRQGISGQTVHEGTAVWRAATNDSAEGWVDPESGGSVPVRRTGKPLAAGILSETPQSVGRSALISTGTITPTVGRVL